MAESKYMELDVELIELDKENPRIKMYLDNQYNKPTAEGIALALSGGVSDGSTSFESLKESIRVNKGIINPIIVNHTSGKYVVIEGNTRVQIYLDFKKQHVAGDWSKIRSIVYEELSAEEIHSIRLQAHMVGPRDWDPYSKAKYLNYLMNEELLPMSQIISFCGGKASEIKKLVSAYNDIEEYYRPMAEESGYDFDFKDFSKFAELQNKGIVDALVLHGYTKADFTKWVINGNIDAAQRIRELPAVLKNKEAKVEFLATNLSNAIKKLGTVAPANIDLNSMDYIDLARALNNKLIKIEYFEQQKLMSQDGAEKRNALTSLRDTISLIVGDDPEEE